MKRFEAFFADADYEIVGDAELYFQNTMYVMCKLMGQYTQVERHTSNGRMDIVVQTDKYIYILELKMDASADEALQQIEDKGYAKPFAADPRKLFKIGVIIVSVSVEKSSACPGPFKIKSAFRKNANFVC